MSAANGYDQGPPLPFGQHPLDEFIYGPSPNPEVRPSDLQAVIPTEQVNNDTPVFTEAAHGGYKDSTEPESADGNPFAHNDAQNPAPPHAVMGNDQSTIVIQVGARGDTTPTPNNRKNKRPNALFSTVRVGPNVATTNWPETTSSAVEEAPTNIENERRPAKRLRAISSPSPPRDLIINRDPARIHPNKVLIANFEGATLADGMFGPRTAHATMDTAQIEQQVVDSDEYQLRLQWKAANLWREQTGVDMFDYPELTYERPIANKSAAAQRPPPSPTPAQTQLPPQADALQGTNPQIQALIQDAVRVQVEKLLFGRTLGDVARRPPSPAPSEGDYGSGSVVSIITAAAAANARFAAPATPSNTARDETAGDEDPPSVGQPRASGSENDVTMNEEAASQPHRDAAQGYAQATPSRLAGQQGPLVMPANASLPVVEAYLTNPNFVSRWSLPEVQAATEGLPMHANRRLIKEHAKDPLNRLFRADHVLDIDKHPELNPIQTAPNPAVARARVMFAQDLLPTTIVPPIPEPFDFALPATEEAKTLLCARPPGLDDFMPKPVDGWPAIHRDSPKGMYRGLTQQRTEHILSQPRNNTVVLNVWGAPGAKAKPIDALYPLVKKILATFLDGFDGFQLIPPQGEWAKDVPPNALNAPALWAVTNIPQNLATKVVEQHCLATVDVTVFCYRPTVTNPQFIMRTGRFVSKDRELIRETIRELFLEGRNRYNLTLMLSTNPNYAGLEANQAYSRFLLTVEIKFTELRGPNGAIDVVAAVYCDPPTQNPERWMQWADDFRCSPIEHSGFLNSGKVLPPIRCSGCHGVDHFIDQCTWPELADWRAPLPGYQPATGRNAPWLGSAGFLQTPTQHASTSTRHQGNSGQHGARRGGPAMGMGFGGAHDSPSQGFGRSQRRPYPG